MAKMEAPTFCPIDEAGKIVRPCKSEEDLARFAAWFRRQAAEGAALPGDRRAFVAEALGEFLGAWLKKANGLAYEEQRAIDDDEGDDFEGDRAEAAARLGIVRRVLFGLADALGPELFEAEMTRLGANRAEIQALEADRAADALLLAELEAALSAGSEEGLLLELRTRLKSPKLRELVRSRGATPHRHSDGDDPFDRFFSLAEFVAMHLGPTRRAERLARFLAYAQSGWAAKDGFGAGAPSVEALVERRIPELLVPLRVKWPADRFEIRDLLQRLASVRLVREEGPAFDRESQLAAGGFVQAAIVSPDRKGVFVYLATGDSTLKALDGDANWWRLRDALSRSRRDPEFMEALGADPDAAFNVAILFPAPLGADGSDEWTRRAFRDELDPSDAEAVLEAAVVGRLTANALDFEVPAIVDFELVPVGAAMDSWHGRARAALSLPDEGERAAAGRAAVCAAASRILARIERRGLRKIEYLDEEALGTDGAAFLAGLPAFLGRAMRAPENETESLAAARRDLAEQGPGVKAFAEAALWRDGSSFPALVPEQFEAMRAELSGGARAGKKKTKTAAIG